MKFCCQKFPRQVRLCSKKGRYGSRSALHKKSSCEFKKRRNFFRVSRARGPGVSAKNQPEAQAAFKQRTSQSPRQPAKRQQVDPEPITQPRVLSTFRFDTLDRKSPSLQTNRAELHTRPSKCQRQETMQRQRSRGYLS